MKRLLAVLLALSLFASCGTLFVFATTSDEITTTPEDIVQPDDDVAPYAAGSSTQTIYINDVAYTATFGVGGSVSNGGHSGFTTKARAIRYHYNLSVCYSTVSTGKETYSGGYRRYDGDEPDKVQGVLVRVSGTTYSGSVCYGGTDTATEILTIKATGKLITVDQDNSTNPYSFTASIAR